MMMATTRAFEAERRRLFHRRMLVASLLALVLVLLFGGVDYFTDRPHFATLFAARLLSAVASAVIFLLLHRPIGRRHPSQLATALILEVGLAIAVIPMAVTGANTPYVSMSLLILSMAALFPWPARQMAVLAATLATLFVAGALLHGVVDVKGFLVQVSAVVITGLIALVITALSDLMRKRESAARRALRVVSRDKTRLIDNLEQKTRELATLNDQLATVNRELEDFLYVASHDLRAPLINVQGFANEVNLGLSDLRAYTNDIQEARAICADIEESVRFIHSGTNRMDGLIKGLLNVSRIATRTNATADVDLETTVQKIVESFQYQLDQHRIDVKVGPLPAVRGDPLRLNQAFSNLIDNAIKYMGNSPTRRIEIGTRNGDGTLLFYVKDTGPGIPEESHEAVFGLFRRLGNGVAGEGLGLTMVRKIVEKHGGRIWVESVSGQGSTFWFTLAAPHRQPFGSTNPGTPASER
jgi:signal transduction histidine kinase